MLSENRHGALCGAARSFVALRSARALWHELDAALRAGAPLPEPWQRKR
ncbi:hypothetical protein [Nocardiopsis metallicus]|uniref:Uncharacterized protein n=1 Tax=Nocardiopsis metallicus TaxID=179819 RepID=A0A840W9V0_9ACTN|nr:hypothetical protein [Nocardiopsis metallicus]